MKDLISICMPVKNTAPFLAECLDSFLNQSYTNWELLAANDASNDNSLEILEAYAAKDSRIKVYQSEGKGVVAALNTAYKKCKGVFISRMDSDDINTPKKFELMQKQLVGSGKKHIALGLVEYFAEGGVGDGYKKYELWMNELIIQGKGFDEIYKECVIPSPCWMLYKEDFDNIGGFNPALYPEDYDLCFRIYKAGIQCLPSLNVFLKWRDRPQRTTRIDDNYKTQKMLALKCYYFLDIDYKKEKNLVLWGAGKRGKFIANYLVEQNISFTWVCNNENKIGHDIYGVVLRSETELSSIKTKQLIISVANREERLAIREKCDSEEWEAYFFC